LNFVCYLQYKILLKKHGIEYVNLLHLRTFKADSHVLGNLGL